MRVRMIDVQKSFGQNEVVKNLSLDIADGELLVLLGESGCGKTTALRMVAGLETVSGGTIEIGDRDVTNVLPKYRNVAMVFQSYALYPHMSVRDNMAFGMKVNGIAADVQNQRIAEAARILQMEEFLDRKPSQLSGGQRQRVAIGRAIVRQPQVFLFDEPLSNLDAKLRIQMRVELEGLHHDLGVTMIYVTHDQVEAMTMADRIVVLNNGRVEQLGAPLDLYHRPSTEFVAGFIGAPSMNFLDIEQDSDGVSYRGSPIPVAVSTGQPARIGIRPEHIVIGKAGTGSLDAKIRVTEQLGGESYIHTLTDPGDQIVARIEGETGLGPGEVVGLLFPPERTHLFGHDGQRLNASP